ncbi:hypothetical protein H2248_004781 [Termitomyces sp. 'cryptogamus']|nr:hypothetical protein H2248_004781 [Termitomyces sp. 'cryptogamus']
MLFPIRSQPLAYLALIYFLFISIDLVDALPLRVRQNGAMTVQTVHVSQTPAGQLTETCDITLTPITDKNGQSAVEEVKRCSLALDNSGGNISSVTSLTVSSSVIGNTIPPSTSMTTGTSPSTVTTATAPSNTQASTFPAGSPSTIPTGTSVFTTPAVPSITGTSSPVSSTPHASGTTTSTGPPFTNSPSGSGTAAADTTSSSSGVSAAASSSAKFEIPGKTISVLPIGLGVFAGISVIALIVVGLVTYERTKYRKAFRQRRLAESGADMGNGGMAQRP